MQQEYSNDPKMHIALFSGYEYPHKTPEDKALCGAEISSVRFWYINIAVAVLCNKEEAIVEENIRRINPSLQNMIDDMCPECIHTHIFQMSLLKAVKL